MEIATYRRLLEGEDSRWGYTGTVSFGQGDSWQHCKDHLYSWLVKVVQSAPWQLVSEGENLSIAQLPAVDSKQAAVCALFQRLPWKLVESVSVILCTGTYCDSPWAEQLDSCSHSITSVMGLGIDFSMTIMTITQARYFLKLLSTQQAPGHITARHSHWPPAACNGFCSAVLVSLAAKLLKYVRSEPTLNIWVLQYPIFHSGKCRDLWKNTEQDRQSDVSHKDSTCSAVLAQELVGAYLHELKL